MITGVELTVVLAVVALASLPGPPAPLPVNWESAADARFQPPVESMLSGELQAFSEEKQVAWQKWGPEAVGYLLHLRMNPFWKELIPNIDLLLYQCPYPQGLDWTESHLRARSASCVEADGDGQACVEFGQALWLASQGQKEALIPLLDELAQCSEPEVLEDVVAAFRGIGCPECDDKRNRIIDRRATSPDAEARESALSLLWHPDISKEDFERLKAFAATISPASELRIQQRWDALQPGRRAKEPMEKILEAERRNSK